MTPNDPDQPRLPAPSFRSVRTGSPIGYLGLIVFPLAILVYMVALPFFAVLWLLEWFLPPHPADSSVEVPENDSPVFPQH